MTDAARRSLNTNEHTVTVPVEDYERMRRGLARYEFVRCLSVQQFSEMLVERNLKEGTPFDTLVDIEMAYAKEKRARERAEEIRDIAVSFNKEWAR